MIMEWVQDLETQEEKSKQDPTLRLNQMTGQSSPSP